MIDRSVNIEGQRFGMLVVLRREGRIGNQAAWLCRCDCGTEKVLRGPKLRNGDTKSCGCNQHVVSQEQREKNNENREYIDITGQRFGSLVAIERLKSLQGDGYPWRCKCDCGGERVVHSWPLRHGKAVGCLDCLGVRRSIAASTVPHDYKPRKQPRGVRGEPEFRVWQNMIGRCENPAMENYPDYGGRGIYVCDGWHDYARFIADMGRRPSPGHSIERANNTGSYTCGKCDNCVANGATFHCVWATPNEQSRNKRNNVFFVYGERRLCAADWARVFGAHPSDLARRVRRNSVDVAFDAYCMERGVDRDAIRRKE